MILLVERQLQGGKVMKFNKLLVSTLAMSAMVAPFVTTVEANQGKFTDVTTKYWAHDIIHEMRDKNVISGYPNGTFKPNEPISRKHAAALVSRAKDLPVVAQFVKFKDVSVNNAYFNDIKKLQQAGIFAPDSKGNFNPNQPLTRGEMAKVLAIAFKLDVNATIDFPDVPVNNQYNKYVRALYSNGITTGDNGYFMPNESLTRAHYAVFMYRALNVNENHVAQPIPEPVLTYEEFVKSIKNNPLFAKEFTLNSFSYNNQNYHNLALTKGQALIKDTNWKYIRGIGEVRFAYDGYKNKLDPNYALLSMEGWDRDLKLRWDFRDPVASQKATEFLELLIPGLGLTDEMLTKSAEARHKEKTGERFIGNREKKQIGKYEMWIGVPGSYQFFDLDIKYVGD